MAAIRSARLPAEADPDQPLRCNQVWGSSTECETCSTSTGRVVSRLLISRAEAALASDCSAGQAVSVVRASTALARWPGLGPGRVPWARRCPPSSGRWVRGR
eukprot:552918-Alexandrium_andersonii.AAC.1